MIALYCQPIVFLPVCMFYGFVKIVGENEHMEHIAKITDLEEDSSLSSACSNCLSHALRSLPWWSGMFPTASPLGRLRSKTIFLTCSIKSICFVSLRFHCISAVSSISSSIFSQFSATFAIRSSNFIGKSMCMALGLVCQ